MLWGNGEIGTWFCPCIYQPYFAWSVLDFSGLPLHPLYSPLIMRHKVEAFAPPPCLCQVAAAAFLVLAVVVAAAVFGVVFSPSPVFVAVFF